MLQPLQNVSLEALNVELWLHQMSYCGQRASFGYEVR